MANNINLNVIGTGNFSNLEAAINSLQVSLANLQKQMASDPIKFQRTVNAQIQGMNDLIKATNAYRIHTVELATEAEQLSRRITKNKVTFNDLMTAMAGARKEGGLFLELGKKQVAMQKAVALQVGSTVHVYEQLNYGLADSRDKALASANAIAAQNAVLRQGAIHIVNWGKNMQWTGRQLTMGITLPLVMFGTQSAKIFNEVDKNLTRLAKVYGVGLAEPTRAQLNSIRKEVLSLSQELGKSLGVSAAEVTDIAAQFAAAGLQGEQLIAATRQASRIVVLGEADKQEAINATISLQTAYKLNTQELTEAVNFFNAAQAATSTSMGDLINAIPRVGPIIKGLGGTYKDMVAILTALKEGGVPAGEAANAIKNSLGRIIQPTEAAKEELMKFGIDIESIVNKNAGNLVATLTELQSGLLKLDGLSRQRAISELFGKYQFARMSAFIENFGQVGTQSQKIMEMMGISAAELARIADTQTRKIQESASGRFKIAVESLKNSLLPAGELFLDVFGRVLTSVDNLIKRIQELPEPVKNFLKIIGGITAIVGPIVMVSGLIGNMMGSIALGLLNIKKVGGAFVSLFGPAGFAGFKTIIGGFREVTPASVAAKNAMQLFTEQQMDAAEAGELLVRILNEQAKAFERLANKVTPSTSMADVRRAAATQAEQTIPADVRRAREFELAKVFQSETTLVPRMYSSYQAALGSRNIPFRPEETGPVEFYRSLGPAATQTQMLEKELTQDPARVTGALGRILPTRAQYTASVSKYLSYLDIALKTDVNKWNKELANLRRAIDSATDDAGIMAAERQFLTNLGISSDQFEMMIRDRIQTLNALDSSVVRSTVGAQERSRIIAMQRAGYVGISPGSKTGGGSERMLYALSGGGFGGSAAGLFGEMSRKGWRYTGVEQSHLTPLPQIVGGMQPDEMAWLQGLIGGAATGGIRPPVDPIEQLKAQMGEMGLKGETSPLGKSRSQRLREMTQKLSRGAGAAGMVASGAMMMGGMGNQTLNNVLMGISMASMLPGGMAIKAAVAAMPLLIQGYSAIAERARIIRAANENAFGISAKEAEIFGIKLAKLGEADLPQFTEEQKRASDAVSAFAEQIKSLEATDPIRAFTDSLADQSIEERLKNLQAKYLTLRIQGLNDQDARNVIQSILRAAGIEMQMMPMTQGMFGQFGGMTPEQIFAQQQTAMLGLAGDRFARYTTTPGGRNVGVAGTQTSEFRSAVAANAQNMFNAIAQSGYQAVSMLNTYSESLSKGSQESVFFNQAVRKMYQASGIGTEAFERLKETGASTSDILSLFKMRMDGSIQSLDTWNRALSNSAYRTAIIETSQARAASQERLSTLSQGLSSAVTRTSIGGGAARTSSQSSKAADAAIKAQERIVEKLQAELELRKKILSAQEDSLSFQDTQAKLQQDYNEALASGDMAAAATAKRQMEIEAVRFKDQQELRKQEDRLAKEQEKLAKLRDAKTAGQSATQTAAAGAARSLDDVNKKYEEMVTNMILKGQDVSGIINKWALEIKNNFGGNINLIRSKIDEFVTSLSGDKFATFGAGLRKALGPAISQAELLLIYTTALKSNKPTVKEAFAEAISQVTGVRTFAGAEGNSYLYQNIGGDRARREGASGEGVKVLQTNRAMGGMITGPGGPKSDIIPAMLSNGEYVVQASAVQQYGVPFLDAINTQRFADGGLVKLLGEISGISGAGRVLSGNASGWMDYLDLLSVIAMPFSLGTSRLATSALRGLSVSRQEGSLIKEFESISSLIGGARSPNIRGTGSGGSTIGAAESGVGTKFSDVFRRKSPIYSSPEAVAYGLTPTVKGDVLVHGMTPGFVQRTQGLEKIAGQSSAILRPEQFAQFGIQSTTKKPFIQLLPSQFVKNTKRFNENLRVGGSIDSYRNVTAEDMVSLLLFMKDRGVDPKTALSVASRAADKLNSLVRSHSGSIDELTFGKYLHEASISGIRSIQRTNMGGGGYIKKYGMGGYIPKYHAGGVANYGNSQEVFARLQRGEVVLSNDTVNMLSSARNNAVNPSSLYNDNSVINVNVAGTNATPQEIANAVSNAIQRRDGMNASRTVIR